MLSSKLIKSLIISTCLISLALADTTTQVYDALKAAATNEEADFNAAVKEAKEHGLPEAQIIELTTLKLLRDGNLDGLFEVLPDLDRLKSEVPFSNQNVFQTKDSLKGFIAALHAIEAFQQSDISTFETQVKTAFWLAPQFSEMFQLGRLVQQYRDQIAMETAMKSLRVPMDLQFEDVDGNQMTLAQMVEGKKAILIDFWASWCGPCMAAMPSLQEKHNQYSPQGVFVMGLNTDQEQQRKKALKVKKDKNMDMPWFLESDGAPLSNLLGVNSIPRMVLITPDGKVHYNGHPLDPSLHQALENLGVGS